MSYYSLRISPDIHGDIRRGWSGWMGSYDTLEDLLYETLDPGEIERGWERWQDAKWHPWHHRDLEDFEEFLLDFADESGLDVDTVSTDEGPRWVIVHSRGGISVFGLLAEMEDDAVVEAREMIAREEELSFGQGDLAVGDIQVVADMGGDWYLLRSDGLEPED